MIRQVPARHKVILPFELDLLRARTSQWMMSGFHHLPDLAQTSHHFRKVPKADTCGTANCALFGHLFGESEQLVGNVSPSAAPRIGARYRSPPDHQAIFTQTGVPAGPVLSVQNQRAAIGLLFVRTSCVMVTHRSPASAFVS
jgi:hypothetical protein